MCGNNVFTLPIISRMNCNIMLVYIYDALEFIQFPNFNFLNYAT